MVEIDVFCLPIIAMERKEKNKMTVGVREAGVALCI
jgi:hypothetical protein